MQAFFLVGEQRSGSNLLRLMIGSTGAIAAPHPPHILQRIDPIVPVQAILDEARFEQLVESVCRLVETNPVLWLNTTLDRDDVKRRCRERHVIAIYGAVMDIHAEANGARAWMCKSMQNVRWAAALDAYFRTNRYVFLHRDARDVALSFTKAVVGDKHVYCIARQWAELQRLCLDVRRRLGPERVFEVGYAALTEDTEATLRRLCGFLGTCYRPEMLAFHESEEARNTAEASSLWENVTRPVIRHNHNKFLDELPEADVRIIESVAGRELDELGYSRAFVPSGAEEHFTPALIAAFRAENEWLKQLRAERMDPADAEKRRRQDQVLAELRRRIERGSKIAV